MLDKKLFCNNKAILVMQKHVRQQKQVTKIFYNSTGNTWCCAKKVFSCQQNEVDVAQKSILYLKK